MGQFVTYRFFVSDEEQITIDLEFDENTYRLVIKDTDLRPDWAKLEHNKCENCPLGSDVEWCPAALAMAKIVPAFRTHVSHEQVSVEVETPARKIYSEMALQRGLASLMGVALAASGCPHTRFLRPMARFHLPFADERETIFRSLSTHLLWLYVQTQRPGRRVELNFDDLKKNYENISTINGFLATRVRGTVEADAAINAVIILDLFAMLTPSDMEGGFKHISGAFELEDL